MLDNNSDSVKRYAPPQQRNRLPNRRKPGGWSAAIRSCNDPYIDLSDMVFFLPVIPPERPVMYSAASGSSWGHSKLPHQIDFLSELLSEIQKSSASAVSAIAGRNSF